jgi:catechol 2,3-dioxygenase-like lactoylglutathione lyase family enzyme
VKLIKGWDTMIQSINNVGVAVADIERAVEFYAKLGFEVTSRDETPAASVQAGAVVLYLFQTGSNEPAAERRPDLTGNPPGIDHLSFDVEDVDVLYHQLKGEVRFEGHPENQTWGYRAVSLCDPDGNRLYFLSALK